MPKTIESATIALLKAKDSLVVKTGTSDKAGNFSFENITEGRYLVSVSAVGYQKAFSQVTELNASNTTAALKPIKLLSQLKTLGTVTVTSKNH
jgi:hypothetical protein